MEAKNKKQKKSPEEERINSSFIRDVFLSNKKVFSFICFFVIRFSSTETCTKNVQHEAKKAVHDHRQGGKKGRERILRTAAERKKSFRT